jgi:DMATS type aromatic prenyltransferase
MGNFEDIATDNLTLLDSLKTTTERSDIFTHPEIEPSARTGFDREKLAPKPTYIEAGIEKLIALANSLEMSDKIPQMVEIFRGMAASWGDRRIGNHAGWESDVSDDLSPFEFSIAFKQNRAELRILLEAQGVEPNLQSNWQAGLQLNQYLAEHYNVSLDRFEQIEDLYAPTNADAKFAIWHSACFYPDKEPEFKIYLNPHSKGSSLAAAVVEESFVRLGFIRAWSTLAETSAQRGPDQDEFVYFSLDLDDEAQARVKTYLRHHDATADDLEKALSAASNYVAGTVTEFCQAMADGQTLFSSKPAITCFSFVAADDAVPSNGTLYIPISNYAPNDRVVRDRIDRYFSQYSLPVSRYYSATQAFAARPIEEGVGMHSYISLCTDRQQRRVSVYLNPEINAIRSANTIVTSGSARSLASLEEIVLRYEEYTVAHHPFLQRLQREPVNPQHIWLLFMNIREAVVTHFTRRLANIIARIDDERIRCVLAKQLNDELGNGEIDRIHRKLFDRLMATIEPWRMESFTENMLIPGQELSNQLEEIYLDKNPYVGIGAAIVMEVHGKQFDLCLGREFRKTTVDLSEITWLTLHEDLEIDHADEAFVLTRFVADSLENVLATKEGAHKTRIASWSFLDGLYRLCFSI